MRLLPVVFYSLLLGIATSFLGFATSAAAQQLAPALIPPPAATTFEIAALAPDQEGELTIWLAAIEKWQKYDEKWRNRPVRDGWGRIVARQAPPAVPAWLPAHCAALAEAHLVGIDSRTERACRLVEDPARQSESVNARRTARRGASEAQFLPQPRAHRRPVDHDAEREPFLRHHRVARESRGRGSAPGVRTARRDVAHRAERARRPSCDPRLYLGY